MPFGAGGQSGAWQPCRTPFARSALRTINRGTPVAPGLAPAATAALPSRPYPSASSRVRVPDRKPSPASRASWRPVGRRSGVGRAVGAAGSCPCRRATCRRLRGRGRTSRLAGLSRRYVSRGPGAAGSSRRASSSGARLARIPVPCSAGGFAVVSIGRRIAGIMGFGHAGGGEAGEVRPVGPRTGVVAWFGQGSNEPMRRLHGSGYRRRAVRMRMRRRYRVLLWVLALAAALVGVTAGALLAQA